MTPFYNYTRDGITQGLLAKFLSCREETKLFLEGWTSKSSSSSALMFGNIIHSCLERYYNDIIKGSFKNKFQHNYFSYTSKLISTVEKFYTSRYAGHDTETYRILGVSFAIAEATLPHYFARWSKDDTSKIKWQGLEQQFRIPFETKNGKKTFLRGKKDGTFTNPGLWLFETKTKSQINEGNLIDTLWFEHQVNFYIYAMLKIYKKYPSGVLYNIIRRTSLERKTKESLQQFISRISADIEKRLDFYFIRYEVALTKTDIDSWKIQLEGMVQDFVDWYDKTIPHYRNTTNCITKYGRCPMLPICSSQNYHFYKKRKNVYEELEEAL